MGISGIRTAVIGTSKILDPGDQFHEFHLPADARNVIDLSGIMMQIQGRMRKKSQDALSYIDLDASDRHVCIVSNSMYSLFSSCSVVIGNSQTEWYQQYHPIRAYIRNLLQLKSDKVASAKSCGFYFNYMLGNDDEKVSNYQNLTKDYDMSKVKEFIGPLLVDPLTTQGFLQTDVECKLTFTRSSPAFYLVMDDATKANNYRFEFTKINLLVPIVTITDSITPFLKEMTALAPSRYKFLAYDCKTYSLPVQSTMFSVARVYNHKLPSRMLAFFLPQNALTGNVKVNPFLTSTKIDVRNFRFYHNGVLSIDYAPTLAGNDYTEAFLNFARFARAQDLPFCVTLDAFKQGSTYYSFDLLQACESPMCSEEVILSGHLSIELELNKPTEESYVLVIIGFSPSSFDIDKNGNCRFNKGVL